MYWHPSIPEDERWQPGVFFHVTDSRWAVGSPLLGWKRQKELGLRDDAEWTERYRGKVALGHDWGVVSLFKTLRDARDYAESWKRRGRGWIVRVDIPPEQLQANFATTVEEADAYRGEIPAAWIMPLEEWGAVTEGEPGPA